MKTFPLIRTFHDLQLERIVATKCGNPLEELSSITTICPNEPKAQELLPNQTKQELGTITILDVGGMHHYGNYQTHSIYEQMPLAPVNFLPGIISMEPPFSVVFTDWLSMMAALGSASRASVFRSFSRKALCIRSHVPSRRHVEK